MIVKKWRDWSIRSKISAALIPALAPLMVTAWMAYRTHADASLKSAHRLAQAVTESAARDLDSYLGVQQHLFEEWNTDDVFGIGIEFAVLEEIKTRFREILEAAPQFKLLALTDPDGKTLTLAARKESDEEKLENNVRKFIAEGAGVSDADASTLALIESKLATQLGACSGKTFVLKAACRDSAGQINGALLAYLDWAPFEMQGTKVADGLEKNEFVGACVALMNPVDGQFLTHTKLRHDEAKLHVDKKSASWFARAENEGNMTVFSVGELKEYVHFSRVLVSERLTIENAETATRPVLATFIPEKAIMTPVKAALWSKAAAFAAGAAFLLAAFWWISGHISRPIREAGLYAQAVARGEFTRQIDSENAPLNEVGDLTRAMAKIMQALMEVVDQINSAGAKVVDASLAQVEGAKGQSIATKEIFTTVTELLSSAQTMAENAGGVTQQADATTKECSNGMAEVERTVQGIKGVHERVDKIAAHMVDLGSKSQQINGVLDIITELSEQTNLLSLNASIEAAGAGDAGKRFAVVAGEIRKLAERATYSAGEIRSLIDGVQDTVNAAIMATEEGAKSVAESVRLTEKVHTSFGRIADQVLSTTQAAKSIEMGSRQQATAIAQIEEAVKNVDVVAEQTETTARLLDEDSRALLETAGRIKGTGQNAQTA